MAEAVETAVYRLRFEGQAEIDRATRSVEGLATAEDKLASSNRTTSAQIQRGIAQYDPLIKQQEKYLVAMKQIENARERGTASESQLTARLELEKKALNDAAVAAEHLRRQQANAQLTPFKSAEASASAFETAINKVEKATVSHTNATKLQGYQMLNLSRQIQDIGVSLFSGQNPVMVAAQQFPQIFDIAQQSGVSMTNMFKQAGAAALSFVSPITVAVGVVTALGAAVLYAANQFDKLQVSAQRAVSGVGARSGTTVADINAFVERSSGVSGTKLSGAEARELANAMTATGKIVVGELDNMSDAVVGFANKTGKSTKEVRDLMVQFATDPIKGMEELEKVWGDLDVATREAVQAQVNARNNTAAFNILLRATAEESEKAAKNMSFLDKATRLLFSSRELLPAPTGIENQVEAARKRVEAAMAAQAPAGPDQAAFAERNAEAVRELNKAYEEQFAKQQKLINQGMALQMNELSKAVGVVEQSIIPQIAQIEKLTTAIEALEIAKAKGVVGPFGAAVDANALTIAKGMKQDLIESQAAAARVTEEVNRIAAAHEGVSRAVAMQLDALEKQVAVAGAVGGAEKLAAQNALDYAEAKKQGANADEATLIALKKQEAAQAAINASAKETLFSLQNQTAVADAVGGAAKMAAQEEATYNQLLHNNVDAQLAASVAAKGTENAQAQRNAQSKEEVWQLQNKAKVIEQATGLIQGQKHSQQELNQLASEMTQKKTWQAEMEGRINQLVHDGVSPEQARAQAAAEYNQHIQEANQAALQQLQGLQQQLQMASAITGQQQIKVQYEQTYNKLLGQGVEETLAQAVAMKEMEVSVAKASASVYKQVKALNDSTAMIYAQKNGTEASTAAAIAYKNAIESGASKTAAAALSAATLANYMAKAAEGASTYSSFIAQGASLSSLMGVAGAPGGAPLAGSMRPDLWHNYGPFVPTGVSVSTLPLSAMEYLRNPGVTTTLADEISARIAGGGVGAALAYASGAQPQQAQEAGVYVQGQYYTQGKTSGMTVTESDILSQVSSLYDLQRSQTQDKSAQAASMQAELAWLQSRPQSLEQQRAVVNLKQSIDSLTNSTDSLNATNRELLSPYYTQDPRTSHIGFRSQGMALGGFVDVPGGVSSNDNMIATIPVASGERIYIDPMNNRRSTASGSGTVINISSPITINGNANADQFGRTLYQSNQQLAKSVRAATQ